MKSTRLCLTTALAALTALLSVNLSYGVSPEEITSTLCRSGGGDWTRVAPVVVDNSTDADFVEKVVSIPIADAPNALPFLNERVESIRVADEDGVELTFNVVRSDDSFLDKGVVDEPCLLSLPATQSAGSKKTYYIFAGNDKAFPNPDRLSSFRKNASNLDFEVGTCEIPNGWRFDVSDSQGTLVWTNENPVSGKRCVRCSVPDGDKRSWIAARQVGVSVEPGAKYRFEARVRGQNVKGQCGWYMHFGNSQTEMLSSPMLPSNKEGDFDWTTVSGEFTAPKSADLLSFGTVLYGTGTAWYDAASLSKIDADGNTIDVTAIGASQEATVGDELALPVAPSYYPSPDGPVATFEPEKLNIGANRRYATVRVQTNETGDSDLVALVMSSLETLWGRDIAEGDVDIIGLDGKVVPAEFYQGSAFFEAKLIPNARNYFVVVEKTSAVGRSSATKGEM
ncbi:MAG: carbohydrate binding domain-containing protein, partial [Thermoguttaceae bacterium]|nr:carbohydrate binding domain-containing protein [Thermoguttaceae bacterium]